MVEVERGRPRRGKGETESLSVPVRGSLLLDERPTGDKGGSDSGKRGFGASGRGVDAVCDWSGPHDDRDKRWGHHGYGPGCEERNQCDGNKPPGRCHLRTVNANGGSHDPVETGDDLHSRALCRTVFQFPRRSGRGDEDVWAAPGSHQ